MCRSMCIACLDVQPASIPSRLGYDFLVILLVTSQDNIYGLPRQIASKVALKDNFNRGG